MLRVLVAIPFVLVLTEGVAGAYWTTSGAGTASASTGTINAPTAVAATNTPGTALVAVSWTNSTPAAGLSPTGYYVTRVRNSDGATFGACGSSPASPTATTPCNDTSVPDGAFHYTVTGVRASWTATSGSSNNVTVASDVTAPSVTVNQKAGQADPTNALPMLWTVTFSETVTGFDTNDLTRGGTSTGGAVTVTGAGANYEISLSGTPTNGSTTFAIAANRAQDLAGNTNTASTSSDNSITYDTTAPTVTGVSSTLADGSYNAGQVVPVTVTFSEIVTVTGTPQLTLSSGTPATTAVNYTSGTGTNVLTFNYTVAAGNTSTDLDYAATTSLALNGGTIRDLATNKATLTLAAPAAPGSLGANKNLVIGSCTPSTVNLTTDADTYIDGINTTNYGTSTVLKIWTDNLISRRILINFPMPAIPAGCRITSSTLSITRSSAAKTGAVVAHSASASWAEGTAHGKTLPAFTGTAVTNTGTDATPSFLVTTLVQNMYPSSNFGFVIKGSVEDGSQVDISYFSRESAGTKPNLSITFGP